MNQEVETADIVALLAALLQANSVNPPGNERSVAMLMSAWLRDHGVQADVLPLSDTRANLMARLTGNANQPALAFCGHMDTVPIGDIPWTHAPFGAEIEGQRIYGRGASDMKSSLAAMAAAMVSLQYRETPLACDVLLLGTAGEEVDCCGASSFVEWGTFDNVGALIIGEPTSMDIGVAHKGALWVRVRVPGRSAHGSMPHLGSNAILNGYKFLESVLAHEFEANAHPLLGLPTVSPNVINGGVSANVVPDRCDVTLDIRTVPGQVHKHVLQDVRALLNTSLPAEEHMGSQIEVILDRAPVDTDRGAVIVRATAETSRRIFGKSPTIKGMAYFTDASVIVPATGIPTILWGPGDAEQAHQTNEYVGIDRVLLASHLYELAAVHYSQFGV